MKKFCFNSIICTLLLSIVSCRQEKGRFATEFDDSTKQVIMSYVKENNIDIKSKVVTANWIVNTDRTDIYISNLFTQMNIDGKDIPLYYSVVNDSIIVFVYSGLENLISRNKQEILIEINEVLSKQKVSLSIDSGYFYHPPTWLYTTCEGNSKIVKKAHALERFYIPCGYSLFLDEQRQDSLYIIQQE